MTKSSDPLPPVDSPASDTPAIKRQKRKGATSNADHRRRRTQPQVSDPEVEKRLYTLVLPIVQETQAYYRQMGLRNRKLGLLAMVAVVLSLIWKKIAGLNELRRLLEREDVLWAERTTVSQTALDKRFLEFPAEIFREIFLKLVDQLPARHAQRKHTDRPLIQSLQKRFNGVFVADGTTLETLFRKVGALRETSSETLGGHLLALCHLGTHLPINFWYLEDADANDKRFCPELLDALPRNSLSVFDLGFFAFAFFDALTDKDCWFITRLRSTTRFAVQKVLLEGPCVRDRIVQFGLDADYPCVHPVRLIEVYVHQQWYRYITNVLDPQRLTILELVEAYALRWSIESAFLLVKRLLDLSYLWVGSSNGVQLQVWATWLYYAVLIDLCDEVAELLQLPFDRISVEMVARGLYHYARAVERGYALSAASYFADPTNHDLGIVKRERPKQIARTLAQVRLALPSAHFPSDPSPAPPAP